MSRLVCCTLVLALGLARAVVAQALSASTSPSPSPRGEGGGVSASFQMMVDSAAREVVITIGPYHVPSDSGMEDMKMDMAMADVLSPRFAWPMNTWVRGYQLTVADSAGRPLSRRLLHHYGVLEFDRRELAYPVIQHLLGGGAETGDVVLPKTVGIPLAAGDRLAMYFMWHNAAGRDLDGVYLRLRIFWIAGNQLPRPTLVQPFWLDVNWHAGEGDEFTVPPGGCVRTYAFDLPVSGRLLAASGHLHEHGGSVRLEDAETGDVIVRVEARREPDGTVRNVSRKLFGIFDDGPHLEAHHRYLMVVTYDNPTRDTLSGMMGLMGGLFVPDDVTAWPVLDRSDPRYLADLKGWEQQIPEETIARARP